MTEAEIKASAAEYEAELRKWVESQKGQQSSYEYEKSYVEFAERLARETFARAVAGKEKSRNTKKK